MLSELRKDPAGLADLLDHFMLVESGVVLLSTGALIAGWEISGHDLDGIDAGESWRLARNLAAKLRMGTGWTIQCDLIRDDHLKYSPATDWPDPVSFLIDKEREARFTRPGVAAPKLSRYFVSVAYSTGGKKSARGAARWMFDRDGDGKTTLDTNLEKFLKGIPDIESILRSSLKSVRRLKSQMTPSGQTADEFLRYVRRCVSGEDHPFAVPDVPAYLNQYLAVDDFTGGSEPCLGDPLHPYMPGKRIAIIAIDGFPAHSFAGILRELDAVPYKFRYCQQAELMDGQEAKEEHEKNRGGWSFKTAPPAKKLIGGAVNPARVSRYAADMESDANDAASLAEHGKEVFVRFSAKIVVMYADRSMMAQAIEHLVRVVRNQCGFSCRIETVCPTAAWLATIPGQHPKDPRKFIVNTENMVHMMPLCAPFRGLETNPSRYFAPDTPPLFYGMTSGGTPYRFQPFVSDVGHQLVCGPVGSGKTTWLGLGIAQWFRYPGAQVFAFDKKRTLYTLCKAMGGQFYEISPDARTTRLCPLQYLDTPSDREHAAQWLELILAGNGLAVTTSHRNGIKEAIDALYAHGGRSLTHFKLAVSDSDIRKAIEFYVNGILDGESDDLGTSRFCVFEMDELYRMDKKTMNGALFYIFGRIRKRLTSGTPTLVTVDEFREALSHEMAAKYFEDFLFEGRKLNMSVWLVVQEMSKVLASPLRSAVIEQCHTKVLLPNPQAVADAAGSYELLGLNSRDREMIAAATSKSDYYVTSEDGKRMISLELHNVALSFLAASSDQDKNVVDALIRQHGSRWPGEWLRLRGLADWGSLFDQLITEREVVAA